LYAVITTKGVYINDNEVLVRFRCFLIIFSAPPHNSLHCHSYSGDITEQEERTMHIQIINFNLKDMTDAELRSTADEVAPAFASVPGLLSKVWLADVAKNTYGGVYIWQDAAAMQAYLASELGKGVLGNPHFANLTTRDFEVLSGPTTVTGGPLAAALTATAGLAS
jgi:quinol monooxygenase YgiN